jgi:hypothetical protein
MHTILLVTHIVSMILSLALMAGAIGFGIFGKNSAAQIASTGMIATTIGALTGATLLFFAPILSECIILTAYLATVTGLYIFGFGAGIADKARFIRSSAAIQKR